MGIRASNQVAVLGAVFALGATVSAQEPSAPVSPVFRGRLLDEDGLPMCSRVLHGSLSIDTESSARSENASLSTDETGRFEFTLPHSPTSEHARVFLEIGGWIDPKSQDPLEQASMRVELPVGASSESQRNLGELVFAPEGSLKRFARMSDDALEAWYRRCQVGVQAEASWRQDVEACLCEIVRRGNARWIAFLERELEHVRIPSKQFWRDVPNDLELLTVLRRAQHKRDPLTVKVAGGPAFELQFPWAPTFACQLVNVDAEGESFFIEEQGRYRRGSSGRCRIDAVDEHGAEVLPLTFHEGGGTDSVSHEAYKPGQGVQLNVPMASHVQLPRPGTYRVRIQFHSASEIAGAAHVRGRIIASSDELVLHAQALRVELTKAERKQLEQWFASIDAKQPVVLLNEHWRPDVVYPGDATTPEEKLFRANWKALPILFDALEKQGIGRQRRAWALGLLWDITGLDHPGLGRMGAIGSCLRFTRFSMLHDPEQQRAANMSGSASASIWPESQDDLVRDWLALRPWLEVVEKD